MMTFEQLATYATRVGVGERAHISRTCGNHQERLATLPRLETTDTPLRYCPDCLTAFTLAGAAVNPPHESSRQR
jgi:hypothetical protein